MLCPLSQAIRYFLRQDYPEKELIVLSAVQHRAETNQWGLS